MSSNKIPKPVNAGNSDAGKSPRQMSWKYLSIALIVLLAVFAAGLSTGRMVGRGSGSKKFSWPTGAIKVNPGPWGDLAYFPITLDPPNELLSVEKVENTPLNWMFDGYTRSDLSGLLSGLGVPEEQQQKLLSPNSVSLSPHALIWNPSREALFQLSPNALQGIYRTLGGFQDNEKLHEVFYASDLESFQGAGISEQTVSLLKKMSVPSGRFLNCYCLPYIVSSIPTYDEKAQFLSTISRQKTMLLKLHVHPETDVNALVDYWGKALWTPDVKALLESVKQLPKGGTLDVVELLPHLPTSLLYTYPIPQNPLEGSSFSRNCSWTAFNFFRDRADSAFSNANYVVEKLKSDYMPVYSDPRYGDVVVFLTPDAQLLHTAVFIADSIVYSKNGDNPLHPWIFTTIPELTETFSSSIAAGQNLTIEYFRNKYI